MAAKRSVAADKLKLLQTYTTAGIDLKVAHFNYEWL